MKTILKNKGALPKTTTKFGGRLVEGSSNRGGSRSKKTQEEMKEEMTKKFIHPDARFCLDHFSKKAVLKCEIENVE